MKINLQVKFIVRNIVLYKHKEIMKTSKSVIGTKIVRSATKETGTVIGFDPIKNRVQIAWDILKCKLGSNEYLPAVKKGWITINGVDLA